MAIPNFGHTVLCMIFRVHRRSKDPIIKGLRHNGVVVDFSKLSTPIVYGLRPPRIIEPWADSTHTPLRYIQLREPTSAELRAGSSARHAVFCAL